MQGYDGLNVYYGDIHSHCAVGYGHGSLEEAFQNARMQLDFACVTVHAHWPDIPVDDAYLADVVAYHQRGFAVTAAAWPRVREVVQANHQSGRFVTFLGFEMHSLQYGDHNVYFKGAEGEVIRAADLEDLRRSLRQYQARGIDCLLIPHHIGYRRGYRGINWAAWTPEFSPVVEIMSMHGAAESPDAPYPYLHTMGPRDWESTYQYGLAQGHVVGAYGSTDHHSAHPGSYGHGRMAVWAEALTRDAVWAAIQARRTVALTGDNIALVFAINGQPMGSVLPPTPERHIEVSIAGGSALDAVDVLHNNRLIHRWSGSPAPAGTASTEPVKVHVEVGWGEKHTTVDWQVELAVEGGDLRAVEPRFRGHEIVEPQAGEEERYAFSQWERRGADGVRFATRTWGNLTTTTASTQGLCLEVQGSAETAITGVINGQPVRVTLAELLAGPRTGYLGGFLRPAYTFHRAVPRSESTCALSLTHRGQGRARDWYTVRVRQTNGQWAWSSPIWVEAGDA